MPPHSAGTGSKTPPAVESNQSSTDVPSSNSHSAEDSKQTVGTDSETKGSISAQAQPSLIGTAPPLTEDSARQTRPRQKSPARASRRVRFLSRYRIM
jgi:hypothetical protein